MAEVKEITVPDIGDFESVDVIEVLVKAGDRIEAEDSLVTLESDKATMEVPSPDGGTVEKVLVAVGDKVSEGSAVIRLALAGGGDNAEAGVDGAAPTGGPDEAVGAASRRDSRSSASEAAAPVPAEKVAAEETTSGTGELAGVEEVHVPDIGDFESVEVIEVLVAPGDTVKAEDSLITLESDKATMEVPAPQGGTVKEVRVKVGDKVSEGTAILTLEGAGGGAAVATQESEPAPGQPEPEPEPPRIEEPGARPSAPHEPQAGASLETDYEPIPQRIDPERQRLAHAGPSVRRLARELGVDLLQVRGSGRKGRITQEDVQAFVRRALQSAAAGAPAAGGMGIPTVELPDFSKFGEVERVPLSRIQRLSGPHLQRSWLNVPHVTQFDEADITEMEAFRQSMKQDAEQRGVKLTLLAFLIKACVAALQKYPRVNSSLAAEGDALIVKRYVNIGVAVDTPQGLVVPVVKGADRKGIFELAEELAALSKKARDGKLAPGDMQGGCFSISSLGGIGGTAFTPIVNAPEVAILGVSRSETKPVWDGDTFEPRLMLPLSFSYDHRVVDGAQAARFTSYLAQMLGDIRRLLL